MEVNERKFSECLAEAYEKYKTERDELLEGNGISKDYIDNIDEDLAEDAFKQGFEAGFNYACEF